MRFCGPGDGGQRSVTLQEIPVDPRKRTSGDNRSADHPVSPMAFPVRPVLPDRLSSVYSLLMAMEGFA